ncbi:NAD(P)-dependent oxidoreductase [Naasia lichenicola]|uniref:NAD-dependent epimerase/dehydratase family protein n=1 Tax=Naasia lichenicola TaxID=2565933 RepID=A0A4S4FME6_9MICO|nr:NAD(P)H-binding protein [Naasia lichenicola]THG31603.1 NAD-dependent epimerase/dehydratase family protein [Naasia lichenicola]
MAAPDGAPQKTFLVFGGTGQTGQHFVRQALGQGHRVRALARNPDKFAFAHADLEVIRGSITEHPDLDALLGGVDFVVSMLGDAEAQRERRINDGFVRQLVPAMRRQGVSRFLYQAGGLSAPPDRALSPVLRLVRSTVARGYDGQHRDNEAVMRYLTEDAADIEWMVHRAGIGSDGPSKGVLRRSQKAISIATFQDCAAYNLRTVMDADAVHTCDVSSYRAPGPRGASAG